LDVFGLSAVVDTIKLSTLVFAEFAVLFALFAVSSATPAVTTAPAATPAAPFAVPATIVIFPCKNKIPVSCNPALVINSAICNSCAFTGIYTPDGTVREILTQEILFYHSILFNSCRII